MVAAWISALTGVGPAMASGSQTYSGIWADLPAAPMKKKTPTRVSAGTPQSVLSAAESIMLGRSAKVRLKAPVVR